MNLGTFVHHLWRESRTARGRLAFFICCLAVGVAAVVAVAGISSAIHQGIRHESRSLLAADLIIRSSRALPEELDHLLARWPDVQRADTKELVTIAAVPSINSEPGRSQLVELKAVGAGYPFYGELKLGSGRDLDAVLAPDAAIVAPDLLARLDLAIGDAFRIGDARFRIADTLLREPDEINFSFALGPRVLISQDGLRLANLERRGSRVRYRALLKVPHADPQRVNFIADQIRDALPDEAFYRIEAYTEGRPSLRRSIDRTTDYLALVALLSLMIGGIGVAQTVRAWIASRMDSIAILKCLGVRPIEVLLLYLGQTLALAAAGTLVGVLAGVALQLVTPAVVGELLPDVELKLWQPGAIARGAGLGIGIALLFSLPPLASVLRVPPARVLRRNAEPLPASRTTALASTALLVGGMFLAAWLQTGELFHSTLFVAGLLMAVGLLAAAAWASMKLVTRFPSHSRRYWLRHGLASLARPGSGTVGAMVALGLGVLVVLAMHLVQLGLSEQLRADLPADAPNAFLVDIQPHQWEEVRSLLEHNQAENLNSVPVIMARLSAVEGVTVEQLVRQARESGERRWVLTREQRLTYLPDIPRGNQIIAGQWWQADDIPEISIEEEFARDLNVQVGSMLELDIQGVPMQFKVANLRKVDWRTFGINFFLIVEPGYLEDAPQQRIAAARLPLDQMRPLQDELVFTFPNVTVINTQDVLNKIAELLAQLGLGVRLLGAFTVIAGVVILAGAISASSLRRGQEVALLKTLGVTRMGVVRLFCVEYALVGLLAGLIGAIGAASLTWGVLRFWLDLQWSLRPLWLLSAVAATALVTVLAGVAASSRALRRRPIEVFRGG